MDATNPGRALAEFVADADDDGIPDEVRAAASIVIIDALASAIAGRAGDELLAVERLVDEAFGPGDSAVLGRARGAASAGAVLLNGYQTTAVAFCDVFRSARCHLSPEVVPPALAVAQTQAASGRRLITAVAVGLEAAARVAMALDYPRLRRRGWHPPGVAGPFGGASAAGSLLGLDAGQLSDAFGIAGSQAAGTYAQWGTATIKLNQARAGLSGYLSAMLAANEFSASREVFTAEDGGLLPVYSGGGRPEELERGLGAEWQLHDLSLRRWPAASPVQVVITSALELAGKIEPKQLRRVRVAVPEAVLSGHGAVGWETPALAQMSLPYVTAVSFLDRRCEMAQFWTERLADPAIAGFVADRFDLEVDEALPATGVRMVVEMEDGTVLAEERAFPKGSPEDPLGRVEVEEKFVRACDGVIGARGAREALALLRSLDDLDDVRDLMGILGEGIR